MKKSFGFHLKPFLFAAFAGCVILSMFHTASAAESICAVVKIEIRQELTLERQAFDAHMKINNGLTGLSLENVVVEVIFSDQDGNPVLASSDPDNTDAAFFIRPDSEKISNSGNNTWDIDPVAPLSSSDLHWLIIPAPGTADGQKNGKRYHVGASLTYTLGGEQHTTEVSPDYIFVKPLPQIALDYFLTRDVYGDDAWTQAVEPPEPFTLGVRVKNNGSSTAHDLKIDSAQPEIVENEQGLLIDFKIRGSRVKGKPAKDSLLVEFGDIEPGDAAVGRWIMTCTLSGEFKDFGATISHADELGGELTSLIRQEDVNTHFLVKDVLVDLPGKDNIRDFLARDAGNLKVYESDNAEGGVSDQSADSGIARLETSGTRYSYEVSTPDDPGFIYIKLPDPHDGDKPLDKATRSDGKHVRPENAWLSKQRKENPEDGWNYFVNLFDVNTTGSYVLVFDDPAQGNQSPQIQFIPDKIIAEEQQVSFPVEATDPDGTMPELVVSGLPAGAEFTDLGEGSAIFEWTPFMGQSGTYRLTFSASDGQQQDSQAMTIAVHPFGDTDADGMDDDWEREYFGNLGRDGKGYGRLVEKAQNIPAGEQDRTSWQIGQSLDENKWYYWRVRATDGAAYSLWAHGRFFVNAQNQAPGVFRISRPADGTEVNALRPVLEVTNSTDPDNDTIAYNFEIYTDSSMSVPVVSAADISPLDGPVSQWQPDIELEDGSVYYWRAVAEDEHGAETTTQAASFTINTANQAPAPPEIASPEAGSVVASPETDLVVNNSTDGNGDPLSYYFEVDTDPAFNSPEIVQSPEITQGLDATSWSIAGLDEDTRYFWRAKADDGRAQSRWAYASFFVNTQNTPPSRPVIKNPGRNAWSGVLAPKLSMHPARNPDADDIVYTFEICKDQNCQDPIIREEADAPVFEPENEFENNTIYYWRVLAADKQGQSPGWSQTAMFFIRQTNQEPVISGAPETAVYQDANYSFTPTAQDPDPGDQLFFTITNKPDWAQFDPESGSLNGTPEMNMWAFQKISSLR